MNHFTFDTETYPFDRVGKATRNIVPRMVCMSFIEDDGTPRLLERERALPLFWEKLKEKDRLVGLNLAFDCGVVVRALQEEGYPEDEVFKRIFEIPKYDVAMAARLDDIANGGMFIKGGYSLAQLTKRFFDVDRSATKKAKGLGPDVWRNRYNELEGVEAEDYPEAAYEYALDDAIYTEKIYQHVQGSKNEAQVPLRSQYDYELHLQSAWGLMVDEEWAANIADCYQQQKDRWAHKLTEFGLMVDGTKKRKKLQELVVDIYREHGSTAPRTAKGNVKTNSDTFKEMEDMGVEDERLEAWTLYQRAEKYLSTYMEPILDAGPGPLCPRFNALVNSGRTSSSGPNVQNFPARKKMEEKIMLAELDEDITDEERVASGFIIGPDIRGCFIPRPGKVFISADYSAIEMAAFAQLYRNLFGKIGTMGEAINDGKDLHLYVVQEILQRDYDDVLAAYEDGDPEVADWRTASKIVNYGSLGGGGPQTLQAGARRQGMKKPLHVFEKAQDAWFRAFSEVRPYFDYIQKLEDWAGQYRVNQHGPDRKTRGWRVRLCVPRGGKSAFPVAANTGFQGLVGDGALWANHLIHQDIYFNEESPLYDSRLLLFVHDEDVVEIDEDKAEPGAQRLSELMVKGMKRFIPDIKVEAEPEILPVRWSK